MQYLFELLKLIFVMALLISLGFFILNKMKQNKTNKISANRMIQVVDTIGIGFKDEVNLLKVGDEYIVMSASSGQMIALKQTEIKSVEAKFEQYFENEKTEAQTKWKDIAQHFKEKVIKK